MDANHRTKKKLVWITPDYFVDCDFNPQILSGLLKTFDIHWIVLLPRANARFSEKDFESIRELPGLALEIRYWKSRARNPKMLIFYQRLYSRIQSLKPDLIYFNEVPTNPYILPIYWRFDKKKTIVTAHDGNVKPSFKLAWISRIVFRLAFRTVKYVNMFSKSQARLFLNDFAHAKIFLNSLALKDFGTSKATKRKDAITFFFFGSINPSKNVPLLIKAGDILHERGVTGFKIGIYGYAPSSDTFRDQIKHPEIFEYDIRAFQNSEIPKIFAENHYMVFPYKQMSQSGALKVAFNYNIPVIVSDLDGFLDEVQDGINGFVFKSGDAKDLARVMEDKIRLHQDEYLSVVNQAAVYNRAHFSADKLTQNYLDMFREVSQTNNVGAS